MVLRSVSRLLKTLGRLRDPRPLTLDEWAEHHRPRVRREVERVLPHVPDGGTFVDVGANVGLFTEMVLERRPACTAILFEPVRCYCERARERFAGNPRVTVHNLALGAEPGRMTIYKPRHNFGGNCLLPELVFDRREGMAQLKADTPIDEEEVEVAVFSDFAREHGIGDVDFVKTDAEGFDAWVLEGMLPWLGERGRLPVLLAELLHPDFNPNPERQTRVVRELAALGFSELDEQRMGKIDDVLFLPRGRPAGG